MISARIEGVPALKAKLRLMQSNARVALKEASLAGAEPVHDEAERLAPRRAAATRIGHLADHIEVEVVKSTPTSCITRIGPDKAHWYGRFLETGTSRMSARPFLRPALDTMKGEAMRRFGAVLRSRLR